MMGLIIKPILSCAIFFILSAAMIFPNAKKNELKSSPKEDASYVPLKTGFLLYPIIILI